MEIYNTRGSEWRKWDLHIHSDASDGKMSCQEIIDKAIEEDLAVIALTDHHTAKNIDKIKRLSSGKNITVISGIEFKTEYGKRSVHLIGLLPDEHDGIELNSKNIESLLINPLEISEAKIIQKGEEELNGKIGVDFSEDEAFKEGIFHVFVDFKKAADKIHELGGIVIPHAGSKTNGIDKEMSHVGKKNVTLYECLGSVKEGLFKEGYIDICEVNKNEDNDFYLSKFNKPSICSSDAHEIGKIGSKYTWIKADPTFEGLKQIKYEPRDRVRIQDEKPEQKSDYQIIDSIVICHDDFGQHSIPLNPNLNTIIGGRSSGKSILLGCIAKKAGDNKPIKPNNDEYEKYIQDVTENASLKWKDGIEGESRYVEFFPQSYINGLAAKSEEINELVDNIVKSKPELKGEIEKYDHFCINNKGKINQEITDLFILNERITEKKRDIKEYGNKKGLEAEIEKINTELSDRISKMESSVTEDEMKQYEKFVNEIAQYEELLNSSSETLQKLEKIKEIIDFDPIDSDLIGLPDELKADLLIHYNNLRLNFNEQWVGIITEYIDAKNIKISDLNDKIIQIHGNPIFTKCRDFFNKSKSYLVLDEKLKTEGKKLNEINNLEKEIGIVEDSIQEAKNKILSLHDEYYVKAEALSKKVKFSKTDVEIFASLEFNENKFQEILSTRFDLRSNEIKEFVEYKHEKNLDYVVFAQKLFDELLLGKISFKNSYGLQQVLIDIFSKNFYDINYDVLYNGDNLSKMSEGKKAFIILCVLLEFSDKECPILIDQPEDDLDNRAIYSQLVDYIRRKKIERQIILATHNPNIVVGADAEEIIVANQHGIGTENKNGIKFNYMSGSLENTKLREESNNILNSQGIKEHVCDILEGGNEAFKKRERKYAIILQ